MDLEAKIRFMLEQWSLDELFEMMDITPERVMEILLEGGHIVLPPFMDDFDVEETSDN